MSDIALVTNFAQLVEFFNQRGIPNLADMAAQAMESPVSAPPLDGRVYLRWEKDSPFLQIVYILIPDLPLERLREVETACCQANARIALPGFGIDYTRRTIYFRISLPTVPGVQPLTLERMLLSVTGNSRDFLAAFRKVVEGEAGARIIDLAVANKPPAA